MALVLTRLDGEAVWIGNIRVSVEDCRKGKARLCIDAPDAVVVVREELLDARDLQALETGADASAIRHRGHRGGRPGRPGAKDCRHHGQSVGRDAGR